jgi:GTP-binding protein EngB required for normal cell division/predicted RNA-binding protein YlqC (UPF0109 family)
MYENYLNSLERCKQIARQEFDCVKQYFAECDASMTALEQQFAKVVKSAGKGNVLLASLEGLKADLQLGYTRLKQQREQNLALKKAQLARFNVMLFGRTMSGKSTIREALTGGDGSSIGQGGQRTTRDVRDYEWNNLRIVDTPGFGAFNGEEDTCIAREILERSDVVLFMLNSDSIQESTFDELAHVHQLNKPLIFVLNMKKDLQNPGNMRRALKNPEKYVYKPEDIEGHVQRLKELATRAGMNAANVRIVPIHAQAAFMSTQTPELQRLKTAEPGTEPASDMGRKLRELSRLDELLELLCAEVEVNGPVRRVQTFLDSAVHHVEQQLILLLQQGEHLEKLRPEYEGGMARIKNWRGKLQRDASRRIADEVNRAYKPLIDAVADFVDDHMESRDIAQQWKKHCQRWPVQPAVERCAQELAEQTRQELAEFTKEMNEGISINVSLEQVHGGQAFDKWDYKRISGWGAAVSSVVGAIAFSNAWNPLGWAAFAFGATLGIFGLFSDSKNTKLRAAKNQARRDLMQGLEQSKQQTRASLQAWFEQTVVQDMVGGTEQQLRDLAQAIQSFVQAMQQTRDKLDGVQHQINSRLLYRTAFIVSGRHQAFAEIRKVVRQPGYASYALISGYFRDKTLLIQMSHVLKERIEVIYANSLEQQLKHLFKGLVQQIELRTKAEDRREAVLHAYAEDMPKILGKQHRRIKLAAAITACTIHIRDLGPASGGARPTMKTNRY